MFNNPAVDGPDPDLTFLRVMLKDYVNAVGSNIEITRLGYVGYAVRFSDHPVHPGGDWVVYDLDDTIIGYTQAKTVRLEHYMRYLNKHRISLDENSASLLINSADILSRWIEQGRKLYHIDAHITLLAWATEIVSQMQSSARAAWAEHFKEQAEQLCAEQPAQMPVDVPFAYSDGQLEFEDQVPGADRIGELFEEVFDAMIRPERNQELLDTIAQINADSQNEAFSLNQGILTYGTPDFQFRKVLELLKDMKEQGVAHGLAYVLLARVKKGVFLEELLNLDPYTNPDALRTGLADDLFNDIPHAILLVDDDPVELESFVSNNGNYSDFRYDLDLMGVRYRHKRLGSKNFEVTATYGEHEGRIGHHLAEEGDRELRHAMYSVLGTQVVPPRNSQAAREERWQNSAAKLAFYKRMTASSHPVSRKATSRRQDEYRKGRRLPAD